MLRLLSLVLAAIVAQQAAPGAPIRTADKTGHVSNYDEAKVKPYTLPDPLVLANGKPVRDAKTWTSERRPEGIRLYEAEIFGRIPKVTPKVAWTVEAASAAAPVSGAIVKKAAGTIGTAAGAPRVNLQIVLPAAARKPVPLILLVQFGGGGAPVAEPPVAAEIIGRGWGYATVGY